VGVAAAAVAEAGELVLEPVPAAEAAAEGAKVSETWKETGNGHPPLAAPEEGPPDCAEPEVAEASVTALTPWMRCSATMV
jgi:hypothetical protein